MKKLHLLALCALVTPVLTLGAGSALAQQSTGQHIDRDQQSSQRNQDATQYNSQTAADRGNMRDQSRMQNRGYMQAAPPNGIQASNLIGREVRITGDETVGTVDDLIINENGQVVAIVVGVGGFLGMGEREVAIGWDDVNRSGPANKQELRIEMTGKSLRSAPEFKRLD